MSLYSINLFSCSYTWSSGRPSGKHERLQLEEFEIFGEFCCVCCCVLCCACHEETITIVLSSFEVMDEADRILNMDFGTEIDKILKSIPRERRTYLYSATMTKKVQKLQRASLKDPVRVEVSSKYQTVDKLQQFYVFVPVKYKVRV